LFRISRPTGWPNKLSHLFVRLDFIRPNFIKYQLTDFSNLIHRLNQENICNNAVTKDPTTPQVNRYNRKQRVYCFSDSICRILQFLNQMFNLSALLLDDALLTGRLKTRDLTARPSKLWRLTSRDWTTRHHIARVDIARLVSLCE